MATIFCIFLFITSIAVLISLPARIPSLRRRAQNSKFFRVNLILSLSGTTIAILVIIFALSMAALNVSLFGPCQIYDGVSQYLNFEFPCSKTDLIMPEIFLRYLFPIFQGSICFSSDAEVCAAADVLPTSMPGLGYWTVGLFFGFITGAFTTYHTRDNRKQKQKLE